MLQRAVKEHKADAPSGASTAQSAKHNANIASSFKGFKANQASLANQFQRAPSFKPNSSRHSPRRALAPLSRSPNTTPPLGGNSFASIYSQQQSFQEVDDPLLSKALPPGVDLNPDDFSSDDENLDLDLEFKQPTSLPPLPKLRPNPDSTLAAEHTLPPQGTNTSVVSWSSSPAGHRLPALQKHGSTGTKRESPIDLTSSPVPAAKRRTLPQQWFNTEDKDSGISVKPAVTPAPKRGLLWDTTASAIKEQKRSLKNQAVKKTTAAPVKGAMSTKDMAGVVNSHSKAKSGTAFQLSKEQSHILDLVVNKGQSVFFTGPAGTGKSVLMRAIIAELKKKWQRDPEKLGITASTGLAACNIGGVTLHSYSGIGLGKDSAPELVKKIRRNPKAKTRWLKTRALVIDEISMVDGDLFDKLSQIGRTLRNNGRPWGGIQLIITGDFFQLPPVPEGFDKKREVKFAFEAATWNTSVDHTIGLTEVFRQKDHEFASMLNEMRLGKVSDQTVQSFRSMARPLQFDDGVEMTELFPTRGEVDGSNQQRLKALGGRVHSYDASDSGSIDPSMRERLLGNMMAPKAIHLKVGAQVMLIKNIDETLVNGSIGTVDRFQTEDDFVRSGGRTGADVAGDSDDDFGTEMMKKRIRAFSKELDTANSNKYTEYPVVRFKATDGSTRDVFVLPEEWKIELPNGEIQAKRSQLPLILAWALSIHKAQGQTLERVKVDLGKIFEKGQAYVALSRATTQHGLQVLRFDKSKVQAHPKVVRFYNQLYSAADATSKKKTTLADYGISKGASEKANGTSQPQADGFDGDVKAGMATYG